MAEASRSVLVTNISPRANEKTVTDFFSFCGKVTNLTLRSHPEGSDAIVTFETEGAAKTALLLTSALIVDRPITVVAHNASTTEFPSTTPPLKDSTTTTLEGDQIQNRPYISDIPAEQRTKTSVIASLVASGYTLSADAIRKAREFDEENHISARINTAAEAFGAKVKEIDEKLNISKTVESLSEQVAEKVKVVDQQLHISEAANSVSTTVSAGVQTLGTKIKEEPTINNAWGKLVATTSQWGEKINELIAPATQTIKAEVDDISNQSKALIKEKMHERGIPFEPETVEYRPLSTESSVLESDSTSTNVQDLLSFDESSVPEKASESPYSLSDNTSTDPDKL